jgi:hypothetical protein
VKKGEFMLKLRGKEGKIKLEQRKMSKKELMKEIKIEGSKEEEERQMK